MVSDRALTSSQNPATIRILLVDDTPIIIERLSKALGAIDGVTIVGASQDRAQAIGDVARLSPNVIVLDILLGDSDGWDVLQVVKQTSPETRVFVFTNCASEKVREQFIAGGADRFFDKSREFSALCQAVRELAGG